MNTKYVLYSSCPVSEFLLFRLKFVQVIIFGNGWWVNFIDSVGSYLLLRPLPSFVRYALFRKATLCIDIHIFNALQAHYFSFISGELVNGKRWRRTRRRQSSIGKLLHFDSTFLFSTNQTFTFTSKLLLHPNLLEVSSPTEHLSKTVSRHFSFHTTTH